MPAELALVEPPEFLWRVEWKTPLRRAVESGRVAHMSVFPEIEPPPIPPRLKSSIAPCALVDARVANALPRRYGQ